ncbi:MAG TPA: hypothetical protein VIZ66_00930 [Sphingomicrobium sp.]
MNWTLVLIGFALSVLMGAGLASLLATLKPDWSVRRRGLTAASVLPAITLVATLFGLLFIKTGVHGQSEHMENLAIAALATLGGGFVLLAFFGGMVGALLAGRRRSP